MRFTRNGATAARNVTIVRAVAAGALVTAVLAACTPARPQGQGAPTPTASERTPPIPKSTVTALAGIRKIKHVIIVMQENRSFDSYFGTYPGCRRHSDEQWRADGLPTESGRQMHPSVSRPGRCQWRRSARHGQRAGRRRPRQDGRIHPAARRGPEVLHEPRRPGVHPWRPARRDGLSHGGRDT